MHIKFYKKTLSDKRYNPHRGNLRTLDAYFMNQTRFDHLKSVQIETYFFKFNAGAHMQTIATTRSEHRNL
jgi:hypothetical protein